MNQLPVLPILLPLLGGALCLFAEHRRFGATAQRFVAWSSMLATLAAAIALLGLARGGDVTAYLLGDWPNHLGIVLMVDRLSALMVMATSILAAACLLGGGSLWLADVARQRMDQLQDPELSIEQAMQDYKRLGYSENWINQRLKSIEIRKELTDEWKKHGLQEGLEFAFLTDVIYKTWADKTAKEYKQHKGLKKENLRDNMTNKELIMSMLAELSTTTRKGTGPDQRLSKVTLAGALALNEDFWSRPELRLYVTKANWNQAAAVANASTFGAGGKTSRTLVGVQYEVWW